MGHWYPTKWGGCGNPEIHPEHIYVEDGTGYACFGRSVPKE